MIPGTIRYQDRWKWFLSASRTFLNPPGPRGKATNLRFRARTFLEMFAKKQLYSLLALFWGDPPGRDGPGLTGLSAKPSLESRHTGMQQTGLADSWGTSHPGWPQKRQIGNSRSNRKYRKNQEKLLKQIKPKETQ